MRQYMQVNLSRAFNSSHGQWAIRKNGIASSTEHCFQLCNSTYQQESHGHLSNPLLKNLQCIAPRTATVLLRTCVHQLQDQQYSHQQESHGDWLAIPHGDPVCQTLSTRFGVRGIPALKVSPILHASERTFFDLFSLRIQVEVITKLSGSGM